MSKFMSTLLALTMTVAVSCGGGGGGNNESPSAQPTATNEIDVGLQEFAFNISGEAHTGELTMNFQNTGKQVHMAVVGRLDKGKTLDDVRAEIAKGNNGPPPPWYHEGAAPNLSILSPGESSSITFDATQAGTYVMLCFITDPSTHKPHVELGMANTFEVSGPDEGTAPQTDGTFSISSDSIQTPDLSSGSHSVSIQNTAKDNAQFNIIKLEPGKTIQDIDAWFQNGATGPAPASFLGGTDGIKPGSSAIMTFDLASGTYTAIANVKGNDITQEFTVS